MMGKLLGLGECALAFGDNPDHRCAWCGVQLEGRRRRWCSDACGNAFANNHSWTNAREAARKRDEWTCQRCGVGEANVRLARAWWTFLETVTRRPGFVSSAAWCELRCSNLGSIADPLEREAWREHNRELQRPWVEAEALLYQHVRGIQLEVNHKEPILGRHGQAGCHHHLDGLETLCRPCHLKETNRQFGRRGSIVGDPELFEATG